MTNGFSRVMNRHAAAVLLPSPPSLWGPQDACVASFWFFTPPPPPTRSSLDSWDGVPRTLKSRSPLLGIHSYSLFLSLEYVKMCFYMLRLPPPRESALSSVFSVHSSSFPPSPLLLKKKKVQFFFFFLICDLMTCFVSDLTIAFDWVWNMNNPSVKASQRPSPPSHPLNSRFKSLRWGRLCLACYQDFSAFPVSAFPFHSTAPPPPPPPSFFSFLFSFQLTPTREQIA